MSNHSLQFWRLWVKLWSQRDTSISETAKDIDSCCVDSVKDIDSHVSETAKDICKANNYQPNCHKSLCSKTASRAPAIKYCLAFHLRKWWRTVEWENLIKIKGDLLVAKLCGANAPESNVRYQDRCSESLTYLEPSSEFQKHTENLSPPVYLCVSVSPCLYSCLCQCSGGHVHCHAIKATGILHVTSLISDKFQQSPVPICIENKIDIARIANTVLVTISL